MRAWPGLLLLALLAAGAPARAEDATAPDGAGEPRPPRRKVRTVLDGKVNLNTASVEMLQMLPGVGLRSATQIVQRREQRPFKRAEELVRVRGFGRKRFQLVRPYVAVEGPTTLRPVWTGLGREEAPSQGG